MEESNVSKVYVTSPVKVSTTSEQNEDIAFSQVANEKRSSKVAILFCHGMGQQVPYETITNVAEALKKNIKQDTFKISQALFGDDTYARVEGVIENKNGERREVHIYEAYWAPFCEGQISFWETVKFLISSGMAGIGFAFGKGFVRWIFGGFRKFKESWLKIPIFVLVTLVVAIISFGPPLLICYAIFSGKELNILNVLLYYILPVGVTVGAYNFVKKFIGDVAIYVSSHKLNKYYETRAKIKECALKISKSIYSAISDDDGNYLYENVVLVGHSLGSVIIYDTLNSLINMDDIADTSKKVKKLNILDRTKYLITFGSPLDKTAFIFRSQVKERSEIREALAASKQPMVVDYRFRPDRWVNIYSWLDLVSARLRYYDWPEWEDSKNPKRIINLQDREALTLANLLGIFYLRAHSQYWNHDLLVSTLLKAVFAR